MALLVLLLFVFVCGAKAVQDVESRVWVDPHSLIDDKQISQDYADKIYVTRQLQKLLNSILHEAKLKEATLGINPVLVPLKFYFTRQTLRTIQKFIEDGSGDVEQALSDMMIGRGGRSDAFHEFTTDESYKSYDHKSGDSKGIMLALMTWLMGAVIWALITSRSIKLALSISSVIFFLIFFFWNIITAYENARVDYLHKLNVPPNCNPNVWWPWSSSQECNDLRKNLSMDPIYSLNLGRIFAQTISSILFSPFPELGKNMGEMVVNFNDALPVLARVWNYFTFPIFFVLIFIAVFFVIIYLFLNFFTRRSVYSSPPNVYSVDSGSSKNTHKTIEPKSSSAPIQQPQIAPSQASKLSLQLKPSKSKSSYFSKIRKKQSALDAKMDKLNSDLDKKLATLRAEN